MFHDREHLADCCCDIGNRFDVRYCHDGVSQHNPRGRSNSTGSDIEDLVAMAHVSRDKVYNRKIKSYMSYDHNPTLSHLGRCIEGKA